MRAPGEPTRQPLARLRRLLGGRDPAGVEAERAGFLP
jgi:hypothetical protein